MESMIAIDTNLLVRLITQDDELQYQFSLELFNTNFYTRYCNLRKWVLRFAYKFKPGEICQAFTKFFGLPNVYITNEKLILQVIQWHEQG